MQTQSNPSRLASELRQTVISAADRFARIDDATVSRRPYPQKWTKKQIIGHLIDSAANNHQRFVRAQLAHDLKLPGYEHEQWVLTQHYQQSDWRSLVTLWREYNLHLAHIIAHTPEDKLATRLTVSDRDPVTLGWLMQDYHDHLRHHVAQIDDPDR